MNNDEYDNYIMKTFDIINFINYNDIINKNQRKLKNQMQLQ